MKILDNLLKPKGWSSKKFAGLFLIVNATIMSYLALLINGIDVNSALVLIGSLLGSGLGSLGIDAINKNTKANSSNVQN